MSNNMSGRHAASQKRKENLKIVDEFKDTCPPHKLHDLETLVKQTKGNKEKISEQIAEWWNEPAPPVEEKWEDVSKRGPKRLAQSSTDQFHSRNDRNAQTTTGGGSGGRGRGGRGAGRSTSSSGGRGSGGTMERNSSRPKNTSAVDDAGVGDSSNPIGAPVPVIKSAERPLQGAWGQRAAASAAPAAAPASEEVLVADSLPTPTNDIPPPVIPENTPSVSGNVTTIKQVAPIAQSQPKAVSTPVTGNVWATKGSAHLIEAEKPKPPPMIQPQKSKQQRNNSRKSVDSVITSSSAMVQDSISAALSAPSAVDTMDGNELPPSLNGSNFNAPGWQPIPESSSTLPNTTVDSDVLAISSEPVTAQMVVDKVVPTIEEKPIMVAPPSTPASLKQTTILNMGHWGETGEGEEAQSLDFAFGSFGHDNDVASVDETTISSSQPQPTPSSVPPPSSAAANDPVSSSTVSPARPPPGLGGLGTMPPLPEKIVHVHELENKMESASLAAATVKKEEVVNKQQSQQQPQQNTLDGNNKIPTNNLSSATGNQYEGLMQMPQFTQTYPYGMGMYGYNAQNPVANGFMGVPTPSGPVLSAGGAIPQQQKQQNLAGQQGLGPQQQQQQQQQQGSIYGASSSNSNAVDKNSDSMNSSNNSTNVTQNQNNAGIPPGMHGAMAYNPALFYGQQHYQMGQPHGVGYGYGYGAQFGAGGFGYQQVMGQGGAYGQHYDGQHYDDQHHGNHANHHVSGNNHQSGYNRNNSGGYKGKNNYYNNNNYNQYQSQFSPQGLGGYGGQPYNMGYNDHFNQRGGYNMDPYMQNYGSQSGGFSNNQDDDQQFGKGNKTKNRPNFGSNPNIQQYQQQGGAGGPQQGGVGSQSQQQQQHFSSGLQGGVSDSGNTGLNYQWGGGGL